MQSGTACNAITRSSIRHLPNGRRNGLSSSGRRQIRTFASLRIPDVRADTRRATTPLFRSSIQVVCTDLSGDPALDPRGGGALADRERRADRIGPSGRGP